MPRLGIPEYNWWNEGLHGVARAGTATVFPQAIGLAATFDEPLIHQVADVISTEFRAKYNATVQSGWLRGLVSWTDGLVAEHQHLSRSSLGSWTRNLWRRSVSDVAYGRRVRHGTAGERFEVFEDGRHPETFRGAQRTGVHAAQRGCACVTPRHGRHLSAGVSRHRDRR